MAIHVHKNGLPLQKKHASHWRVPCSLRRWPRGRAMVDQVVERVREGIFSGEFPPGSDLPSERNLAETIGVSYTAIREAMRALRAQGVVEVSQGRRPRIKPVSPDALQECLGNMLGRTETSLHELTEFRRPLKGEIAALAAQRATEEHLEAMEEAFRRQRDATTLDKQIDADYHSDDLFARAAGNSLFRRMLSPPMRLSRKSRRRTISRVGVGHALCGHLAILDAVRRRDPQAAREPIFEHVRMAAEDLGVEI